MPPTSMSLRRQALNLIAEIDQILTDTKSYNENNKFGAYVNPDPSGAMAHNREQCVKLLSELDRIEKGG